MPGAYTQQIPLASIYWVLIVYRFVLKASGVGSRADEVPAATEVVTGLMSSEQWSPGWGPHPVASSFPRWALVVLLWS